MSKKFTLLIAFLYLLINPTTAQNLFDLKFEEGKGYAIEKFIDADNKTYQPSKSVELLTFEVCAPNNLNQKEQFSVSSDQRTKYLAVDAAFKRYSHGLRGEVKFQNTSADTIWLTNVVPFGVDNKHVYITGIGNHGLSRSHLFRPGYKPVNVILPDNAWELGYGQRELDQDLNVCALTRRDTKTVQNGKRRRFETELYPGGSVVYTFYADFYNGDWQEGLRLMFQDRMLYDVEPGEFNNSLFERDDLAWIRHSYLNYTMMGWDHNFYDNEKGRYTLNDFIEKNNEILGGAEIYELWPTWPALGMDQRNQWDMYRSMPGGLEKLRKLSGMCHYNNSKFFIAFKPWDHSTRNEDPYIGLSNVVKQIEADGVVLDCSGASSKQLREAADKGRKGVAMYSEGMAVPKDMQGIVSGRIHNALYYCPMLNLNKLIKPDFAIFRVAEIGKERIRREYNLSLFNGYGTEINMFCAGRPYWVDEQYKHLARILMIQRENAMNFTEFSYTPLIPTKRDDVYVNKWPLNDKTIYTIYSLVPEGIYESLFEVDSSEGYHFVDLWNHKECALKQENGRSYVVADIDAFSKKWLGTNNEGAVGVIARFPKKLNAELNIAADELSFTPMAGDRIRVWAGMPGYMGSYKDYPAQEKTIRMLEEFGRSEGKFVIQLFEKDQLIDEQVVTFKPASARLVSKLELVSKEIKKLDGMVEIPAGKYIMRVKEGDQFITYPKPIIEDTVQMDSYYMDKYPVTNMEFKIFLEKSKYKPTDQENYLKHWENGEIPEGQENKPVVYISYEDAKAYAKWAGKRLPTELEWQYAAQSGDPMREWPWGNDMALSKETTFVNNTLTVESIKGFDGKMCNPGNGNYEEIGKYPEGENPWGLQDLVGCVWQLTNDEYDNGSYSYIMLKGGCYFKAESSWWYVQGGPQSLSWRQMLLRISQGFERKATVGFRCVTDNKY